MTASGSSPATAAPVQSSIAARTLATWITLIATVGCVFAARALIARGLGPTGVGLFVLMLTAAFLGGTVLSVGLPAYNASFASKVSPAVLLSNSIAWNAVAAVVLAATCIPALLSPAIPLNWKMIILGVLMAPFTALLESTRGIFQGMSAMRPYNWLGLLSGLINVGAVSTLVATSRLNLETAVGCWVGATVLSAVIAIWLGSRQAGGLQPVDRQVLFGSLRFGGQAWLSQLTGLINFRIALLLTEWLLGTAAVGLYGIAVTIAELLFYFPNSLAIVSSARYAAATPAEARALLARSARWVVLISTTTALAIALAARFAIRIVFGPSYAESADILMIILPGVVAYTPIAVVTWYFNAHVNKPIVNLVIAGFSATLNGSLTLLWAPRYGLAGVAWATTTAYVAASLFSIIMIRRNAPSS